MQEHETSAAGGLLSDGPVRRLCVGFILAEQTRLHARNLISQAQMQTLQQPGLLPDQIDEIRVDEATLGFDSLGMLDLILQVNRFFNLHQTGVEDYLLVHRKIGEWVGLIQQHFASVGAGAEFTFCTSGSAGPVKEITHKHASLMREIAALAGSPLAAQNQPKRIIALVPPQHIYGFLFTCLLPDHLCCPVVDLHRAAPTAACRVATGEDLVVATPHTWDMIHRMRQHFAPQVWGVTSAGPSSATTWDVPAQNGLAQLTEVYGSTETGGIGIRTQMDHPFRLLPHLARMGTEIRWGAAPCSALDLQDHLDWEDSARFQVRGRLDDVVQVGGVNVSPAHVCDVLRAFDQVRDAAVRVEDGRLKAFIVPQAGAEGAQACAEQIRAQIVDALPAVARPHALTFGQDLPRNAMGKLCDWEVRAATPELQ